MSSNLKSAGFSFRDIFATAWDVFQEKPLGMFLPVLGISAVHEN